MQVAKINELECIGCNKCLPPCPTDAIIGMPKFLHTVILEDCIGCGKCLPVCPVDCISLVQLDKPSFDETTPESRRERAAYIKARHQQHKQRLQTKQDQAKTAYQQSKAERFSYMQNLKQ